MGIKLFAIWLCGVFVGVSWARLYYHWKASQHRKKVIESWRNAKVVEVTPEQFEALIDIHV